MRKFIVTSLSALALLTAQSAIASDAPGGAGPTAAAPPVSSGSDLGSWILIGLLVLGSIAIVSTALRKNVPGGDRQREERLAVNSSDLARISATLLASLVALVTFLLVVGIQSRINGFTTELYTALILLGAGMILYVACNVLRELALRGGDLASKLSSATRMLQQLVFAGSIVAVVWFVISYTQMIVKPPAPPEPQQSGQPSTQQQPSGEGQPPSQPSAEPQPAPEPQPQPQPQPQPAQ